MPRIWIKLAVRSTANTTDAAVVTMTRTCAGTRSNRLSRAGWAKKFTHSMSVLNKSNPGTQMRPLMLSGMFE